MSEEYRQIVDEAVVQAMFNKQTDIIGAYIGELSKMNIEACVLLASQHSRLVYTIVKHKTNIKA